MTGSDPTVAAEFTVEPFDAGGPGPHVEAAIAAARAVAGVEIDVGPFGTGVRGAAPSVLAALAAATEAALTAGATRVVTQVEVDGRG